MRGWIGVDLDATLAEYNGWVSETHIGEPIPAMVARVHKWLAEGVRVKIFTARVSDDPTGKVNKVIQEWCKLHLGLVLEVTCRKDYAMLELWDDRAVRVIPNTGNPCCDDAL